MRLGDSAREPLSCSPRQAAAPTAHVYRLAQQHMIPVLPRNQHAPMKRMSDIAAVAHSRAWKKCEVRTVAWFYKCR